MKQQDAKFSIYGNESSAMVTVEKMDGNLYISVLFKTGDVEIDTTLLGAKASSEALVALQKIINQLKTNN